MEMLRYYDYLQYTAILSVYSLAHFVFGKDGVGTDQIVDVDKYYEKTFDADYWVQVMDFENPHGTVSPCLRRETDRVGSYGCKHPCD